ncbi:MAG: QueT transporter family protein [Candidatus Thorarchaeota archaeon]
MQQPKFNYIQQISLLVIMSALYAVLTWAITPIAYGLFQFRISDVLLPFPYLLGWPMALALFIGGAIANFLSFYGPIDIIVGSLLNLLAGLLVANRKTCPHWILAWIYPTLIIGLGIPAMMVIWFAPLETFWLWVVSIMTSTGILCAIGILLMQAIVRALPQYFMSEKPMKSK